MGRRKATHRERERAREAVINVGLWFTFSVLEGPFVESLPVSSSLFVCVCV